MKTSKRVIFIFIIFFAFFALTPRVFKVSADELTDNIDEQLEYIDFNELEDFFASIENLPEDFDVVSMIFKMLEGDSQIDVDSVSKYMSSIFFSGIKKMLPSFISVIIIALLCGILKNLRSSFLSEGVGNVTLFACLSGIILILFFEFFSLWQNSINTIENIAKLTEIMSPILLTLMIASGGSASASIYTPTVAFLSGTITNVVLTVLIPLVGAIIIFSIINSMSSGVKLNKFIDFFSSTVKWIIGLIVAVFSVYLSIQGVSSAIFDGVSLKAAKYAISNSIPIVGGFLRDGFDIVVAGSVLIKNTIGVVCVFGLFYIVMSPILNILVFSVLLKAVNAIIEPITDEKIVGFCSGISKGLTYLNACLIIVGVMFFVLVLLMIIGANAFI